MYITRVQIEQLKGFEKLSFNLGHGSPPYYHGWTVFTGDNASGKSTLLKAIALALNGPSFARSLQPSLKGWVRKGAAMASIALSVQRGSRDQYKGAGKTAEKLKAVLEIVEDDKEPLLRRGKVKDTGPTRGPWYDNPDGWFSCGYGPFRRLYGESSDAQRVMSGPGAVARYATMFREDASLVECERWVRDQHFRALERGAESTILKDVKTILNDEFLQNGIVADSIDTDGLVLRDKGGTKFTLQDMSDGYRAAIALLLDIVRHMVAVYGDGFHISNDKDGRIMVDCPGVVLIDEIDSHLHPEWQRQIGFWLKRKFPSVQFLVTTHSPLVCQAADQGGIFYLPGPGSSDQPYQLTDADYQNLINSKSDKILLGPAFRLRNTRSDRVVNKEARYSQLTAKLQGSLCPAEAEELAQLKAELQPLFEDR
jgi:energy-coupling factor transporter ATP-binding protein EcfA2